MIKKIFFILLAVVLLQGNVFAQAQDKSDERTTTTRIADLLAQLPARDAKQLKGNMQEIAQLGEDGYVTLISGLTAPGKGNNALLEYAIGGFSAYVTQPGQENWRKMSVNAYVKALAKLSDKQNKSFIISQLELVGKDDAIASLQPYLADAQLADPAARALVKINSPAAKAALLNGLAKANGAAKLSIVEALGDSRDKAAAKAIAPLTTGESNLAKMSLYALAYIADPSSEPVLAAAAEKAGYKYDNTNAVAAYVWYAEQLMKNGEKVEANKIAKKILEQVKADDQVHIRTAALKLVSDFSKAQSDEYLFAAMSDKQFQYRAAALKLALPNLTPVTADQWTKKIAKADPATQVAIIDMLGDSKIKSVLPAITALFKSNDLAVRSAAIAAAGKIGQEQVLGNLLKTMGRGDGATITAVSDAISRMSGDGITAKVAAFIPKAKPEVQVALINVLASRAANAQLSTIYGQLKSKNPEVKQAAFTALKQTVTSENLPQLFKLLNETPGQTELVKVQDAIIAAMKGVKNNDQQVDMVLQQMAATSADKKPLFYKMLASLGGDKSLKAVSEAFNTGDESTKTAAIAALSSWADIGAADELIKIARQPANAAYVNKAVDGYLRLVRAAKYQPEQRLLLLREAMAVAKAPAQQQQILKDIEQGKCLNALLFAGRYLDNPALQQAAANAVMNITLADKSYNGALVKDLLNKTISVIKGADSEYQIEAMRKYLAEMPKGEGFVPMFNGTDLTGWKGLVGDPLKRAKMDAATLATAQAKADAEALDSWKPINGELQFMSHGNNLATVKKYGDFEMLVDWKIIDDKKGEGDAGIYLRGTPQVQIWDNARVKVGAQVGSGGLYNNKTNESKPLKVADNKLDEWNTFRILMKGDRVTVYLNGELVTDNVILENFWDRNLPIFAEEQIELQAHGSPVAYRDLYIREIPRAKPFELSAKEKKEGYKVLFDGTNMHSWTGNTTDYTIEDGNIAIRPKPGKGSGGNLFTKEEFSDFIYRFEFKLTPGANNGLGIRAPLTGDAAYQGMELQILDNDAPIYKDLHVYQYHGSVYGTIPAKRGFLKPVGEWNYEEVIVKGPKIKVILNGTVILDADLTEARKNGAADGKSHPGLLRESGHIGFLGHGSPVEFRNIRIKDLSKKK
ncbi:family 16 glycoside hydrolase [Pedobacter nyackensis]|uniref:HEAT repeat n=1 Tax=Pedobacter nyackensis TaxID=475255 RepID=A0A1W2E2P3_9SPHI|nr:family 16 glycoside hydrolase [Pedobacter nyackensis]SMD04084.1 HEAT repeat [Pedobacter nyackensis]